MRFVPLALALALACSAWTSFGDGPERTGDTQPGAQSPARDFVLPLEGRIVGQVLDDGGTFYAATTAGEVAAFTADGFVRWTANVGQLAMPCQQLDGYGILGTGVIDDASGTLYVADAFGRLHALDLATGAERAGWPIRVFSDFRRELVWGALTLADGSVYVPTASYCDSASPGGVYRVDVASQQITAWVSVPQAEGGGGGVWGWGGTAYSPDDDALYAVTANAFGGGSNTGSDFTESAGYGEHLVKLAPDLTVEEASHPADLFTPADLDFVGSPVVFDRPGCGELVVAADKDDEVYGWNARAVGDGPLWSLPLEPYDSADPLLSQLAWSPAANSVYAVTGTQLVRITVGADCDAKVDWSKPLGTKTENGSPTIAGNTVWFAVNGKSTDLVGYDARTGESTFSAPLGGLTLEAPTIADNRLVVGTMTGMVEGFSLGDPPALHVKAEPISWAGKKYGWQARENGVYATENAGATWHRIYPGPALEALRLSKDEGLISIGDEPGSCMCSTRQFWTGSNGAHWHETLTIPEHFAKSGRKLYFWTDTRLSTLATLPRTTSSSHFATTSLASFTDGTISSVQTIPGGVAVLVSSRIHGQGWDTAPRVLIVNGTSVQSVTLPAIRGRPLVQSLDADWPKLTVTATDFNPNPARAAVWVSADGGATWSTG